jgi:hypothetical protein
MQHHATLAPSSFPALQYCSHFVGHGEGNEASLRGDRVHLETVKLLENKKPSNPLNEDEAKAARWMADKTKELLSGEKPGGIGTRVEIVDPFSGDLLTFGTVDVWGYDKWDCPRLIDWKTGRMDDYSAQLQVYALGLMDQLEVNTMDCYILYGDLQKWSYQLANRFDCECLVNRTIERQSNTYEPYNKNKYCARCRLRPNCPAWTEAAEVALAVAGVEDLQFKEGLDLVVKDPDKLARFIKGWRCLAKLVEDHDVTGKAIEFIESGVPVGNYKVQERKGRRTYAADSVRVILELIKDGTLDVEKASHMFKLDANEVEGFFEENNKPCPIQSIIKGMFKILVEKNGRE